jgi:ABC-type polysaccharide/polyol phosphate export permease
MVPESLRPWILWNPVGLLISPFRAILYDGAWPTASYWAAAGLFSILLLAAGIAASTLGGRNAADHV